MTDLNSDETPGFAPDQPNDARKKGEWKSRYSDPAAHKAIRWETGYLCIHFALCPILLAFLNSGCLENCKWLQVDDERILFFNLAASAWLSGLLGGTLFSLKWLYHSVAKEIWNIDRRLWRVLTPHLSGGVAFVVFIIITSGIFDFFDVNKLKEIPLTMAIGFISGYFSDTAVAKMSEIAQSLFGNTSKRNNG